MGKKSQPAPDYSELAASSREAIALGRDISNRQMDFAERQYEEMAPVLRGVADSQIAAQNQQMEQAKDYYDYHVETFRPLEKEMVADAREFSTDSYRDRMAGKAAAAAGRAFSNTQQGLARRQAAMGVNPNSPAAQAAAQQANVGLAANRAGAMTAASSQADNLGWAKGLDAVGLGRGLAGASTAAYQGATGAGSAGAGTYQAAGNQYMTGLNAAGQTGLGGYSTGMRGQGQILNTQADVYQSGLNATGEFWGGVLGAAGTVGGGWAGGLGN